MIDEKALSSLLEDSSRALFGNSVSEEYSHDEMCAASRVPDAVMRVKSTAEVSRVMRYAYENDIPVTVRGAGTGLVGACVPVCGGIVMDMSLMNHILEFDDDNLTMTTEPGVLLMEIAAAAAERGFLYPPDPGEKTATIGGNISTNAGGMRAVRYGVTRDYVRALEVVLPNGETVNFGTKSVKDSSGYSLKHLMIGSEGTLGIITKATLRLVVMPKRHISLLVPFPTLKAAIDTVPLIMRSNSTPTAVEFMQRSVIENAEEYLGSRFPDSASDAYLLLRFDGNSTREIEENYDIAAAICLESGASDIFISDTDERDETLWKPRGAFLEAIKASTTQMDEVDVAVPRANINEMVEFSHTLEAKTNIRIKSFGHAGDGNLHIYVLRDALGEGEWSEKLGCVMDAMYEKAHELGGVVSGEHGIGYAKKAYLCRDLPKANIELMRAIKAAFDPKGLLNPGKIF